MSEVYVLEPPTNGKVVLHTTHGDLDVELWAKECPKASRNFVQLCIDGYYDGTPFHRVVKDFLIQGGDPTGTGQGGESIFGSSPFPVETHPRLRFRYRGLVGLASLEDVGDDKRHGSQFFVTLARTEFLNGKHTIFGKVTGHSLYNLLSIAEVECDPKTDRPIESAPKILSSEVLYSPFGDLHPRPGSRATQSAIEGKSQEAVKVPKIVRAALSSKKSNLLSFDESEEEGSVTCEKSEAPGEKGREVQSLSKSENAQSDAQKESSENAQSEAQKESSENAQSDAQKESLRKLKERVARTQQSATLEQSPSESSEASSSESEGSVEEESEVKKKSREKTAEEIEHLKKEILAFKRGQGTIGRNESESVQDADLLSEREKRRRLFVNRRRQTTKRQRENETMSKLSTFTKRLRESSSNGIEEEVVVQEATEDDEDDGNWLIGGGLKFAVDSARAYELDAAKDALVTFDPLASKSVEEIEEKMRRLRSQFNKLNDAENETIIERGK